MPSTDGGKREKSTPFDHVHLRWHEEVPMDRPPVEPAPAEPAAGEPTGGEPKPTPKAKAGGRAPEPKAAPKAGGEPKPFHTFMRKDGKQVTYMTPEELTADLQRNYFAQSDYSRAMDGLGQREQTIRQREQQLEAQARSLKELEDKFAGLKKFSEARPDVFTRWQQEAGLQPSPDESHQRTVALVEQLKTELMEMLQPVFDMVKEKEFNDTQDELFGRLAPEFPGLQRAEVEEFMSGLAGNTEAFTRAMIHAFQHQRGLQQGGPEQERQAAEQAAMRRAGHLPAGPSPTKPDVEYGSIEEAKQAAMEDARAQGLV